MFLLVYFQRYVFGHPNTVFFNRCINVDARDQNSGRWLGYHLELLMSLRKFVEIRQFFSVFFSVFFSFCFLSRVMFIPNRASLWYNDEIIRSKSSSLYSIDRYGSPSFRNTRWTVPRCAFVSVKMSALWARCMRRETWKISCGCHPQTGREWKKKISKQHTITSRGPFLESPDNFSGPKSHS